jgi:hypothetical protein
VTHCNCLGYGPSVGITIGQLGQVGSLITGKPKEAFFNCGSDLHEFIEVFKIKLAERGQEGIDDMVTEVWVDEGAGGKQFDPHPAGLYPAVCSQVVDLGLQATQWGDKLKVKISFQLGDDHLRTDGKRFTVSRQYTRTLNEKSNLRKELEIWRGKKFTATELARFNLGVLEGINCQLQLVHKAGKNGNTYANIQVILPPSKGEPKLLVKIEDIPKPKDVTVGSVTGPAIDQDIPF